MRQRVMRVISTLVAESTFCFRISMLAKGVCPLSLSYSARCVGVEEEGTDWFIQYLLDVDCIDKVSGSQVKVDK